MAGATRRGSTEDPDPPHSRMRALLVNLAFIFLEPPRPMSSQTCVLVLPPSSPALALGNLAGPERTSQPWQRRDRTPGQQKSGRLGAHIVPVAFEPLGTVGRKGRERGGKMASGRLISLRASFSSFFPPPPPDLVMRWEASQGASPPWWEGWGWDSPRLSPPRRWERSITVPGGWGVGAGEGMRRPLCWTIT